MAERRIEDKLSFKDKLVLRILWEYQIENGFPASRRDIVKSLVREIAYLTGEMGIDSDELYLGSNSTSIVQNSIAVLHNEGYINRAEEKARGIKLIKESVLPVVLPSRTKKSVQESGK